MISALFSRLIILTFGTLYPAYASYKAVRTKNVKEYVKWMMYWIVYAFFTCTETFTDIFLSWFPFYYEVKVIIVLWLLSPATKGSSTLYRKFVHPMLTRREQEIDEYLNQAKERGYSAVLQLGSKGVNYATNVIMQTAIKGGGNLVQTIRRSYSLSDLSEPDIHRTEDEVDDVVTMRPQQRMLRQRLNTPVGRSASGTRHSTGMYFTEVDVAAKGAGDFNYNIRSSDDISSGYSSAEPISGGLSRTSSMSNASKSRLKAKRSEVEFDTCEDRLNYELDYKLSENEDEYKDKMDHESEMDLIFEDNKDNIENENFEQCTEEYFETKSSASDYTSDMEDNNFNNSIEDQKFLLSDPHNDSLLHKSINLNEMRTSLKEIENNFRTNIKGSSTSNYNTQRAYVHKKGKAPQPPAAHPTLNINKNSDQIRKCSLKETEI
ncbi:receptor expression-enhancing protein 4 isoform X1 [Lucilia sericata]|uniref:receptor expression-enhancing protein 4 isoform X1 n=1 Tax=Lucilia sericata TaxID=13632 RepID=UPI0018A7ED0D|nr:receptor expression-enhancing protein 4 isoform X1 [Lucilia sericata]